MYRKSRKENMAYSLTLSPWLGFSRRKDHKTKSAGSVKWAHLPLIAWPETKSFKCIKKQKQRQAHTPGKINPKDLWLHVTLLHQKKTSHTPYKYISQTVKSRLSRTTPEVSLFIHQNTSPEHADPADQKIAKIAILSVRERNKGIHMQYKYGVKSSSF